MEQTHTSRDNLTRLLNLGRRKRPRVNRAYSRAVRLLQMLLPLLALAIVAIVMTWPRMGDTVAPIPRENVIPDTMGRNELIDARYESINRDGQPYIVTAARAIQEKSDSDVILLNRPAANFTSRPGTVLNVRSADGTYSQIDQTLLLEGQVILTQTGGYEFRSEKLDINLKSSRAITNLDVSGAGPEGTLTAKGMEADNATGTIIFTGPAKMVLTPQPKKAKNP